MANLNQKTAWIVWGCLLLAMLGITAKYAVVQSRKTPLPVLGNVEQFDLTNQDNQRVTLQSLNGRVWVADLIFTRCAGQCPIMSHHMKDLQAQLSADLPIKLVSLTTDPGYDTPAILKKYAARYAAQDGRWLFLTGPKSGLRHLAVDSLKLAMVEKKPGQNDDPNDLFIHSEKLVLVDKHGRIRAYFDGEQEDSVPQAAAAARALARED